MPTIDELKQLQKLPLEVKIRKTEQRIKEWVDYYGIEGVYVSFSGGKDSTVLLHIARKLYKNIKAMFVDIPTQYPELRKFVDTFENVDIIRPEKNFFKICEEYGFPIFSKEIAECVEGARKYDKEYNKNLHNAKIRGGVRLIIVIEWLIYLELKDEVKIQMKMV